MASHQPTRRVRGALALSASLVAALGLGAFPASATPGADPSPAQPGPVSSRHLDLTAGKLLGGLAHSTTGRQAVFVQFAGRGAADVAAHSFGHLAASLAKGRRVAVARTADSVLGTAKQQDRRVSELFEVSNAVPGMAIEANSDALQAIAARGDVVKVSPLVPKTLSNASTAALTRALSTWKYVGDTGSKVKVGIIDTGLDYTHADFGGPGTTAAYSSAVANETDPNWRAGLPAKGQAKVAGGYDFVGNSYDANPTDETYQPVPHPDANPVDCNEHGTHVAGTVAGYGVNKDGSTFTGDYKKLNGSSLYDMKVGPGMAPNAELYSLKVFGCTGSTNVVIPALDWALDPNGDGDFSDHLDIVNLSLGSDYGTVDDPENAVVNELAAHGVLPVIAMGNNGDLTDTGGAPGNAVRSLAVASTVDAYQLRDGLEVNAPSDVAGIAAGQVSVAYDWAKNGPTGQPVTGDVVAIPGDDADGCKPLSTTDAAKVAGKVAWLEWDDNDATRRCGSAGRSANVKAAGAIGAIFTSSLNVFGAGITGDKDIPVFQLPKVQTDRLRPAVDAGTLNVTFDGKNVATIQDITPSITDTLSGFSSRGTHGSLGVVKPDVAAPGDTIASAKMGSGDDVLTISGTSMATPHTAGISALVKAAHRTWTTEQIKAAVMNTAGHDVYSGENHTGHRYGPARVGAGRVDARRAVTTQVLAYASHPAGAVSTSFGVVGAPITSKTVTKTRSLTVQNLGKRATTVSLSYDPVVRQRGVHYRVFPSTLSVPAHKTRRATVTMTVVPSRLLHTIDPTMAVNQLGAPRQFVSDASGRILVTPAHKAALRVPVYGAAKPVSETTATASAGKVVMHGSGVAQGTGSKAFTSLASVMTFGASSGKLPVCQNGLVGQCVYNASSRAGDLQYVGAGSVTDASSQAKGLLWFGLSSYADWATIGNSIVPYVSIDTTGDGKPDFETDVQNYPDTDLLVAATFDLTSGDMVDLEPVNFNWGDVDTNTFDSNVLLAPVDGAALGLPASGSAPISYRVGTYDAFQGSVLDETEPVSFDAGDPAVSVDDVLYEDAGRSAVSYTLGASAKDGAKALVLHLHGASGHRAEVLDLPGSAG